MSLFINISTRSSVLQSLKYFLPFQAIHTTKVENLYAISAVGIDGYLETRKKTKEQFTNLSDKFRTKMIEFVTQDNQMIFSEDLKKMVHLAEPNDLELIQNMVKKFNSQSSEYRFGSFVYGPVVMRMFHFLAAPNEALKCFEDPANDAFFAQHSTYQILLDLLYKNAMYEEMYQVFDKIQQKQLNMTKYPKYIVVLMLAACYKQNTPESFKYASNLWSNMLTAGAEPLRRSCAFFSALALNQGAPAVALEALTTQRNAQYVTIRNIKAMALAEVDRLDEALPLLRSVLEIDRPEQIGKHTFFADAVERVRKAVEKIQDADLQKEFDGIEKALRERNLIDNQTLAQVLNAEIKRAPKRQDNTVFQTRNQRKPFYNRPNNTFNLA